MKGCLGIVVMLVLVLIEVLENPRWVGVAVGVGYNSEPYPLAVYLLEGAIALVLVGIVVYLLRRR